MRRLKHLHWERVVYMAQHIIVENAFCLRLCGYLDRKCTFVHVFLLFPIPVLVLKL